MTRFRNSIVLGAIIGLMAGISLAQTLPVPAPVKPQHEVHVYLRESDYQAFRKDFEKATTTPDGVRLVKVDLKRARLLMVTIFNASQGVEPKKSGAKTPR